jgi:hypothetical protein
MSQIIFKNIFCDTKIVFLMAIMHLIFMALNNRLLQNISKT